MPGPFPQQVVISDVAIGPYGRATSGIYLGDGPDMEEVGGRFLGSAAPDALDPHGPGPLRRLDNYLDRLIWRAIHASRFGFVSWDPASFFCSLAHTFKNRGTWAILFTDPNPAGGRFVDLYRSPIVLDVQADGRVLVHFGPRKKPDPRDYDEGGTQYRGRFCCLRDAVSALCGEIGRAHV